MTQKTQIILTDDIDGGPATETVAFSLDGTNYELDLNSKNASGMRKTLERYVSVSRRVSRGSAASGRRGSRRSTSAVDASAVRAWAASHRVKVSPRGRISADVLAKFQAAGN
jgi:uncharacterized protein (DUF4415 family)